MQATQTRTEALEQQISHTRKLLWNASQMRNASSVFRLQAQLDRLIDERRRGIR